MASKQDVLGFISAEGFSASGYEEQILNKFLAFLEAPAPVAEAPAAEVVEEPKAKAKK